MEWGAEYKKEDIRDQIRESEFIDSAGYFIRQPHLGQENNQPYSPFNNPIIAYNSTNAQNSVVTNRLSGFVQYGKKTKWNEHNIYYNIGLRAQQWNINTGGASKSMSILNPRAQFTLKPNWEKDMIFRLSGGIYQQPPFYRELRDKSGIVNINVKAQKSMHFVVGNEYSFYALGTTIYFT